MTNNKQTDVKRFTKKPVTISAIQWTGDNLPDVIEFTGKHPRWGDWFADMGEYIAHVRSDGNRFKIFTLEGVMDALPGDWIIRGVQGEHYPCKPDIFAATYDPAELQERRKADSELVSHRYKLDQSGDVTSELTELRIRRWKMQALRDAHNPESTQQVKLYACAMYEACEWIQEQFRDDELSKKS
ncbi:hypothetical protein ACSVMK_11460 [Salmonella enterica]|uniref:hypothetical protein n=1 Tax=Salmonella enterica TaxID=28901 RepID=UPI001D9033F2|nr:hypothetical protein [Salmonella enterica]EID3166169.1 hypothetical protein [Salmonella enterica]EID3173359.1 hypothetical protein [Salmonella enterica]EID3177891.1 hypothetical protein [Salmonella enterica]EID3198604.1 hypothetical protein [Salmonella enterica]